MSVRKLIANNRGVALIITILILSLMVPMALRFMSFTFFYQVSAQNFVSGIKATRAAESGIEYASAVLFEDASSNEIDSLHDAWADSRTLGSELKTLFDDAGVSVKIVDISGKLNINRLILTGQAGKENHFDVVQKNIFTRLLEATNPDLKEEEIGNIVNSVKDWIDPDDEVTEEGGVGAESEYYAGAGKAYACRNGPMESIEELRFVKGITARIFSDISPYLTVYGDKKGKININTAPKQVLKALSDDIYNEEVDTLVEYRDESDENGLKDRFWYQKALNTQEDLIYPDLLTTESNYFELISTGASGATKKRITCVVKRDDQTVKILSWKIDDE